MYRLLPWFKVNKPKKVLVIVPEYQQQQALIQAF
jgi:hypothetical protein